MSWVEWAGTPRRVLSDQCDHGGTEEVCPYCSSCHSCEGDCWYAVEERSAELSADLARDIERGH